MAREPWAALARHWGLVGPPLRPVQEDLERLQAVWGSALRHHVTGRRLDLLLLGVTPEYACHAWAPDFFLTAVDASEVMIQAVWPGDAANRQARLGDWLRLPFAEASVDLILCDNGPSVFVGFSRLVALGREMRRVLRGEGRVVMRLLVRPARPESPVEVARAVSSGQIRGFHELKLRLLMAVQGGQAEAGVGLGDTWECFTRHFPDRAALAAQIGCTLETISTIDAYRGNESRYAFYSLAEMARVFGDFDLSVGPPGHYPMAECCPVFSLTPKL